MRKPSVADWIIRLVTILLPGIFLAIILLQPWAEPKWMFLDTLTAAQLSGECCSTYYGFVSTVGIMLWVATAAVCLFCAVILFANKQSQGLLLFALTAGLLTGWLALDDAFLLHENVLPSLGVPQNVVLGIYVVLTLAYIGTSWRVIVDNDYWLLVLGAGAFAASLAIDTILKSLDPILVELEDSAKFIGIFCWASFHITTLAKTLINSDPRN
ncbi:MAG: hypothetical protein L3J32_03380 [Rhizobiaceae bacterium]|nr:hypothetical protein [Rhizobiaceae bacterium]